MMHTLLSKRWGIDYVRQEPLLLSMVSNRMDTQLGPKESKTEKMAAKGCHQELSEYRKGLWSAAIHHQLPALL